MYPAFKVLMLEINPNLQERPLQDGSSVRDSGHHSTYGVPTAPTSHCGYEQTDLPRDINVQLELALNPGELGRRPPIYEPM